MHGPFIATTSQKISNRKIVAMIRKYIDKSLCEDVLTHTQMFELWSKFESKIQKKTPINETSLGLVNQLTKIDINKDDELQTLLLLSATQFVD
ncbi:hypothetical protein Lal_00000413 [Lupinus albus]|nr:hypothetical protein Lal_00000413 [Lupinus albus]